CLAFSPDKRTLAFGEDSRLGLWDIALGKERESDSSPTGSIRRVIFGRDGKTLVTSSDDQVHRLVEWDLGAGRASRPLQGKVVWAHLFALSPDTQTLAATGYDQSLHLWDTTTGTEIRKIPLPIQQRSMSLEAVAFSPDGRLIAGGGNFDDGSVRVWSAAT